MATILLDRRSTLMIIPIVTREAEDPQDPDEEISTGLPTRVTLGDLKDWLDSAASEA